MLPVATAAPDAFKDRLKDYKQRSKDPSFFKRMMAQASLARTRDKRALATLMKEYGRFPDPRDQSQHFVAGLAAEYFDGAGFVADLETWRNRNARPEHAWLWYRTLIVHAKNGGVADALKIVRSKKNGFLRAAAVEALAALRLPQSLEAVPVVLASLPKDDAQRAALVNSTASVLLSRSHEAGTPTHFGLCRKLMDQLDLPDTPEASKVVIARALQKTFDVPYAFTQGAPWRQVLASVQSLMEIPDLRGEDVKPVTLSGIRARGNRICYVLDYSETAAREIAPWDEQALQGKQPDPSAGGEPAPGASLRALAMRQAVEASLAGLTEDQAFAILYHRHGETGLVPGTEGIQPATAKNVAAAREAMKALHPKHACDLHAGLMHAFALTSKDFAKKSEYVDPIAMLEGCDTIFVLAQSGAVRDTWAPAGPVPEGEGRMMEDGRYVLGLYSDPEHLAQELRRWNLFRKVQIHAVAVGDAPKEELRELFRPYRGWNTLGTNEARTADADAADNLFEAVNREYEAYLRRPSLHMRMRGRRRLAKTRDARALDVLARSYARPEAPVHRVPHLLVSLCAEHFGKPEHLPRFHAWREAHKEPRDAWLWYRSLLLDLEHGQPGPVETVAREGEEPYLRLAAIRAIASKRGPGCVPLAGDLLDALPPHGPARDLLLESIAGLLQARGHVRTASDFGPPCETLIRQLEDAQVPTRTRKVLARHLAKIFRTDMAYGLDWRKWLRELQGAQAGGTPPPEKPPDVYAPFEFLGIPSAGASICYVVDASDSMLQPITGEERRRLSRVVTGPEKDKKPKDDPLPWDKIHTRFDVAREYLKISLRKITKDKTFAIVLFGTDAELIPSTPHLVAATPAAVREVIRNLDDIKPGPKSEIRPHGTLRGFTNMHGGLDLAFRVTREGIGAPDPYVDPTMLAQGVDTIYLLSDGDPSTDDYRAVDRPDTGDVQADPETRAAQEKVPDVTFYGPYVDFDDYLIDDVRRMNLFRNAAIHCIGFGEANMQLLRQLAAAGLGETRNLGRED